MGGPNLRVGRRGWAPERTRPAVGGLGGAVARPGGCRVPTRPQGGTLVPRPERSGGPLGADPRWPGTFHPVTQPRVGDVVRRRRRRRRYAPPPPARGRAVRREAAAQDRERPADAGKQDADAGKEAELRAEAPCWEAAPLVLVSGNRSGRRGQNRRGAGPERRWRPRCGLSRTS